ncbi:hypothetical protein D920_02152, partial [Enterococcus faecalis 13-SD-W-01]
LADFELMPQMLACEHRLSKSRETASYIFNHFMGNLKETGHPMSSLFYSMGCFL